jgi:WD40 repeat protein
VDVRDGSELALLAGHSAGVYSCVTSPDGRRILSASHDQTLRIWDAASAKMLRTLSGHTSAVTACAVSPDGRWIVSAGKDGTLKTWDLASGEEGCTLRGHASAVGGCAVCPDGQRIVSVSEDGMLRVWDAALQTELASMPLPTHGSCAAVHPWRPSAVCGDSSGALHFLDFVGLKYGPIIVTAAERDGVLTLRCPACWKLHPVTRDQLGTELTCPTPECGLRLRANPFALGAPGPEPLGTREQRTDSRPSTPESEPEGRRRWFRR